MATYERRFWDGDPSGPSRHDRLSGWYEAYVPDPLLGRTLSWSTDTLALLAAAEGAIAGLSPAGPRSQLGSLDGLLLRTEAAASSWIEGIPPRAQQVAFAELALDEDGLRIPSEAARLVANNIHVLRTAAISLARKPTLTPADLDSLQRELVTDERNLGIRTFQNWIGGSQFHPLDAAHIPPPVDHVDRLLTDLTGFMSSPHMPPLIQAGLVHAQLETIHPFPDGNGRVGRAIIHTVLSRRGVTARATLPISLVLLARKDEYIAGLTSYRHVGPQDGAEAIAAADAWLQVFLRAVIDAVDQVDVIAAEIRELHDTWSRRLTEHRVAQGRARRPRTDSAIRTLLDGLIEAPVMTNRTAERLFHVSESAASGAFSELTAAGITRRQRDRQTVVHFAPELLDLLDVTERRLAAPVLEPDRRGTRDGEPESTVQSLEDVMADAEWSDRARSVWAKTDSDGHGEMSLVRHLEDAAGVAGDLWDHWLPVSVKGVISTGLPRGEADGRVLLTWVSGLHDIGKATPGFAVKAAYTPGNEYLLSAMADHGLTCPPHVRGGPPLPPHCHVGQYVLSQWLVEKHGAGGYAAAALAAPVGMHHGTPPDDLELRSYRGSQWTGHRSDVWRAVQAELIEGMTRRTGMDARLPDLIAHPPSDAAQVLLSAAVVVADWLSSDRTRFVPRDPRPVEERLEDAGLEEALRGPWEAPAPVTSAAELLELRFPRLSGRGIHPMQQQVRDTAAALSEPALLVVEAPMGSGKTEAALMAAEELARTFGSGGIFVALPTMATSDAMFARVLEWTRHATGASAQTMFLAHGKARLNEDYSVLVRESHVRGINESEGSNATTQRAEQASVSSWLTGRRKGVLANLVVGTIDQVLFGALKSRHVALRHLALAGKVVIVDEVHAADAYMRRYLIRALEWLAAYGSPVVLLSATLPPAQLRELTSAYARGRGVRTPTEISPTAYPRLTVQTTEVVQTHVPWTGEVTEVSLLPVESALEELVDRVSADVRAGGCVVVIRNTVRSAQETYTALRTALGADRTALLHSQFVASDRSAKEREVLSMLGPPSPGVDRPKGFVVVGTQVLEQSLDIDADVMETDHAPVDLLLQRIGRLHRHTRGLGQGDRPESLRRATVRVMGIPSTLGEPELDRGSVAVYGALPLLASAAVLAPHVAGMPIRLPEDIAPLVEAAYDEELSAPSGWEQVWEEAEDRYVEDKRRSEARARTFRLGPPHAHPTLTGWLDGRSSEGEESVAGQARVRDTEDSLEVLVVWQDAAGSIRLLPGDHEYSGSDLGATQTGPPPSPLALSVLSSSVRLPNRITGRGRIDAVIKELEVAGWQLFSGWKESPWLSGHLVLCLNADLRATVVGQTLRYDAELGLVVETAEAGHE